MLRRHLDVFFQHLGPFISALVLIPILLGGTVFVFDRSQLVTARIWANRPAFLAGVAGVNDTLAGPPADSEAAVLRELVATDSFAGGVLNVADPGFTARSADQRSADIAALRRDLRITTVGNHVLAITYQTARPEHGVAVVNQIVQSFGTTLEAIELQEATGSGGAAAAGLAGARADLQASLVELQRYTASLPDRDPAILRQDPTYLTLSADANAKLDHYLSLLSVTQQSDAAKSAVPSLRNAMIQLLDPPVAQPAPLSIRTPAARLFLIGLLGTVATELALVYLIGLRDPRIRSADDVRRRIGLRFLGSAPVVGRLLP